MSRFFVRALVLVLLAAPSATAFAAPPTATTTAASSITTSSAVLNGTGTPNGEPTTGWFRYATTSPGTCSDTFGTRVPATSGTDLGSGAVAVPYSITATGLTSGVTYFYCSIVANASGTAFGTVQTFTAPGAPVVTTGGATSVTSTAATLQGSASPLAASTTAWFRYATTSPGTCNDTFGTRAPTSGGSALGMGTASVDFSRAISGLTPGATYYYCAIASNAHGTSFGAVFSFTTPGTAPTASTGGATLVTGSSAQLNGSGVPGGDATTGWFRYATTSPGTCNDTFGTRAPGSGGSALGAGNTSVAFSAPVSGLAQGTTYYFCAITANTYGTAFGSVLTFTTPSAPSVTTHAASAITATGATLNGAGIANRAATTGWFRYATTSPGTCNDTFGSRAPVSGGSSLGAGATSTAYSQAITGLSAGTTYYYCAIASNAEGTTFGSVLSFTTLAAPVVSTDAATPVASSSATLRGNANPSGATTTGWFRYATTNPGACSDTFGTRTPASGGTALGAGTTPVNYSAALSGLTPATTYYYCAIASNTYGTALGAILSFTTPAAAPTTATSSASAITGNGAQLNGSSNPGGDTTTGWFRYATTSPGTCNDTFGTRTPASGGSALGAGTSSAAFSQSITGLTPGTTYYYCAIASNSVGTTFGSVVTFVTHAAPSVTTHAASAITATGATLNGAGIANRAATTGWFRYATTSPGTCNDTFGSRAPVSGGSSLGAGTTSTAYSQAITGLSAGTTYYYCAIASNAEGTAFGSVLSFTTLAAPTVTTDAATPIASSSATLRGNANPNGATASGWFRYATTSPGTCSDTFGTRIPATAIALGAGTAPVNYNAALTGLTPATTYYYCAIASNTYGTAFGTVLSFTTPAAAPVTVTSSASPITGTTAQLNGSSNPGGDTTTGWFRYSTTSPGTCNDTFGTRTPASGGSALGAGTSSVSFSQPITGLTPGTTYYYCAIASNSVGTTFGSVASFVTHAAPTVITTAASSITATSATVSGSANPNRAATTGWFRYSTTNPGTCNDSFGSRAPVSGGSSLGAGSTTTTYSQSITGLSAGTTYYYCAIASNAEGTAFGSVLAFTTLAAPSVTTDAATPVASSSATLRGNANPNGATTTGWFRYATTSPGTCSDTFGTRIPATAIALGAGTAPVNYNAALTGLTPATTYYYCAIASNTYGTAFGAVLSFTTPAAAPTTVTSAATALTGSSAQLNGSSNPGGDTTTGWFRYSTTSPGTCNDTFGTRTPASGGSALGAGTSSVSFSQPITGLSAGTIYYFCAIASNSVGTTFGSVLTFTTPAAPLVTTTSASSITATSATLNGSANPNRAATTGWFRYSTTSPGTCNDSFGSRAPASGGSSLGSGSTNTAYSQSITGLSAGTTYYYCAIASNVDGTGFGSVLSFTTLAAPSVTTDAATPVASSSATLRGTASPNGATSTGWFRYATTSPGTCNDTFGTRIPATAIALGAGTAPVAYNAALSGLTPATTYYYCAIASNAYGTAFGSVLSFTTPAAAPTAVTSSPTLLTGTTAQLNGSSNPGGDATTGWFRYATTSPGTCNDTFGTRAPASGGSVLGAGTTSASFSQSITGLTPATTYFYCAITSNSVGTSFGSVVTFTTPSAPTVTTVSATSITATSAALNGAGVANRATTTGWFRYATTSPGSCNDTFGSRAPVSGGSSLGSGTASTTYAQSITGLSPGTTYYYCAIASNAEGTAFGALLSFTTLAVPSVTTSPATLVTSTTATLNGAANPNGGATTGWFRYATSNPGACNDTFGTRAPATSGVALGAGSSPVTYAQSISGLLPGATYYYCAIASNAVGTGLGTVLSFTTAPSLPSVTTSAQSGVTTNAATLNGSANPNGSTATGWFRIDTLSPGTCNDSFGTRVPSTDGAPLGGGNTSAAFSQTATGLSPGTTYYYCAIASNAVGTSFGAVRSFSTTAPPTVSTFAATPVTATTATLNASANPNGFATTGWFRYATTSPGACSDTFGTRAPVSGGSALGSVSTPVSYSQALTGLSPGTTYYFCAIASSSIGTTLGEVLSFTTPPAPPSVTTLAASSIGPTLATLNGSANPNGAATTGWFRYATTSPGTCNDTFGTRTPASGGTALGAGNAGVPYAASIAGLTTGVTYYYCAIASSSFGTTFGAVLSFTTTMAPAVTSQPATAVSSTGATLNGSANPNGAAATGWFRYATTSPGSCNDTFGTRAPASGGTTLGSGSSAVSYAQALTGLLPGTTYYYCAVASSSAGTGLGAVLSFTTSAPPAVTTELATAITSTGATLNGTATPNLAATTGWFRYATSDPGTCNDTFGTRAPASGGTALGMGASPVSYAQALTGLAAGTTYYYCALASSSAGTGTGVVRSFTTPAAPTVTTLAANGVTSAGATLNGSASPNGATATGWFRYATTSPGTCNDTFGTRTPATGGAALGSGGAAVAYSQALTGLAAGTTYYYCAIASNTAGTRFGAVLSFTTLAAPSVTTVAASAITSTGATLNGSANPRGSSATGWFRYATTSPGTCNDTFGTATGGSALGAGTAASAYAQPITGLTPGTTYYFCAIASNAVGTSLGAVLSFTTPSAPTVTTSPATALSSTGATLQGSASPNGTSTTGWFRYTTADPGTCSDSFGTRAPAGGGTALGAGTSAASFSQAVTGLTPSTTYYFCAIASSSIGTSFGAVLSFTTPAAPLAPTVTTDAATAIASNAATLSGSATPNGTASTGWFRYGTTDPGSCNDTFGTRAPTTGGTALGAGSGAVAYTQALTGLMPSTTYYFCAIASSSAGTGFGVVRSFTTQAAPVVPSVTTEAATGVASNAATLSGAATPNGLASTGWFRWSTTNPVTCTDTFGTRAPAAGGTALGAGTAPAAYSQALSGLTPSTTYYYCAIASSSAGTGFGAVRSFTTSPAPLGPSVTTEPATALASTSATLSGSATPNGLATNAWFRYASANPGTCNDTFGTRAPAVVSFAVGDGTSAVPYAQPITGLTAGTTYYYCAIASSAAGTGFGAVRSFTTPSAPTVTTELASGVLRTGATLEGSASPNGAETSGWFRFGTTSPGTCDDSFGTRAPASVSIALGAGTTAVPFSQAIAGLTPGTTYYYCAIASNAAGTRFGAVRSFVTAAGPSAPVVTTEPATAVSAEGATLEGTASPNLAETSAWFRYATTEPGACDDTFGTRAPATGALGLGAGGSAVPFEQAITGLAPATTYYYCAIAANDAGTSFGEVRAVTTSAIPPTAVTQAPTDVADDAAVLNGAGVPNGAAALGWFRYDTTDPGACDDTFGARAPASGGLALGEGTTSVPFSEMITGLEPGTTYFYCAVVETALGTAFGEVVSFTPGALAPDVVTLSATAIGATGATVAGTANANGLATAGWFRFGEVDPGACDDAFGRRAPASGELTIGAGTAPVGFEQALEGLEPSRTYYYCAAASNAGGAAFGAVRAFTTGALPPVVRTLAPEVGDGVVTLSGAADPRGSATSAWFRYASSDPGACDDSFGVRAPAGDGVALGDGRAEVPFAELAAGLAPGTYFVCAIASNAGGVAFGEVVSFVVDAEAEGGGCGCRVGARGASPGLMLGLLGGLALVITARRRRRRG